MCSLLYYDLDSNGNRMTADNMHSEPPTSYKNGEDSTSSASGGHSTRLSGANIFRAERPNLRTSNLVGNVRHAVFAVLLYTCCTVGYTHL